MSGMNTANSTLLTRQEIWSRDLKESLQDELSATKYIDMIVDFPDGDTFTIPSIGEAQVDDYVEDTAVTYRPLDTGEWQFTIDEYIQSATHISNKAMQDVFYANQLLAGFVPKQHRAIMEHFETTVLAKPEAIFSANGQGAINGAKHRMAGGNGGQIELADFAYASYALKKANVADTNMVAIVDPSVAFLLDTLSNLTSVSNNPMWEGIVADGISTGMKFVKNIYGFDVYTSNYLPDVTDGALPERDGSTTKDYSSVNGKANYFFSAASDVLPWKAAWRQTPTVESEYNKDFQRTEIVTTGRYGAKLYRPENMVTVVNLPIVS
jgi:HK97 family phage major capsid protein